MTNSKEAQPVIAIPADHPPLVSRSHHLDSLRKFADLRLHTDRPDDPQVLLDRLRGADILLNSRSSVRIDRSLLEQLPELKMVAVCGVGYDSVDLAAAKDHGVVVSNVPGRTATVVAEHAFALMFAVARRVPQMTRELRLGQWSDALGMSLQQKQVGVVGTGNIGCEMIRLCRAIGMEVVAWSFNPDQKKADRLGFRYVELPELLRTSNVVSLHTRLSDQSRGLLSAERLKQMPAGSILINTARAAVVDTAALVEALNCGHLFGAGIDVYDQEPMVADHPLTKCETAILTPHSADQTQEGIDALTLGCVENITAFLAGTPGNVVS